MADADALYRFGGPSLAWPLTVEQLTSNDGEPGHSAWVLCDGDECVGQFELRVTGRDAWLSRVIIDPRRRGQGLARELITLAMDRAAASGAATIGLRVVAGNDPAIRTYVRAGFEMLPERVRPDALTMRAQLR